MFKNPSAGQLTLPVILIISSVVIEVALAFALVSYFLTNSVLGERLSIRAESAALAGIRDVLIKITRNKDFATLCPSKLTYQLTVDGDTADIEVCRVDSGSQYIFTVNAASVSATRQKKITATVSVDKTTGLVQLQALREAPVSSGAASRIIRRPPRGRL